MDVAKRGGASKAGKLTSGFAIIATEFLPFATETSGGVTNLQLDFRYCEIEGLAVATFPLLLPFTAVSLDILIGGSYFVLNHWHVDYAIKCDDRQFYIHYSWF